MTWNYRVILHDLDPDPDKHWLAVHEVHYGMPNDPTQPGLGWGKEPATFSCAADEGVETIIKMLDRALSSVGNPDVSDIIIKESEWERHRRPSR